MKKKSLYNSPIPKKQHEKNSSFCDKTEVMFHHRNPAAGNPTIWFQGSLWEFGPTLKKTKVTLVNDHIAGWNDIPIFNRKYIGSIRVHVSPTAYVIVDAGSCSSPCRDDTKTQ